MPSNEEQDRPSGFRIWGFSINTSPNGRLALDGGRNTEVHPSADSKLSVDGNSFWAINCVSKTNQRSGIHFNSGNLARLGVCITSRRQLEQKEGNAMDVSLFFTLTDFLRRKYYVIGQSHHKASMRRWRQSNVI
jgi:hypothetical protein